MPFLDVRDYLSNMIITLSSTFELLTGCHDLDPLTTDSQHQFRFQNLWSELRTSVSVFNAEQEKVFKALVGAIVRGFIFSPAIDSIFLAHANNIQLWFLTNSNTTPFSLQFQSFYLLLSISLPSLIPSPLLLSDAPDGKGRTFVPNALKGFLHLCNRNDSAVWTSAGAA